MNCADCGSPKTDSETYPASTQIVPRGVGGWLLFFILAIVFIGPAVHVAVFLRSYRHIMEIFQRIPHRYSHYEFYVVEQLAGVAVYCYGIFTGIQLWKTRAAAVTHAKRFLLLLVLYQLADVAVGLNFAWIMDPRGTVGRYLSGGLLRQLRGLVGPAVWYWYLLKSKRVRNTFLLSDPTPARPSVTPS